MSSSLLMDFLCRRSGPFTSFVPGTFEAAYRPSSLTAQKSQVSSRLKRDGTCLFLLGITCPGYRQLAAVDYRATNASGVYGGAGIGIVPVPLLRTASVPTSGSAGRMAGVAYLTLNVHVPPPASGEVKERSEEHTSELQSPCNLVCRLLLEKKKKNRMNHLCELT